MPRCLCQPGPRPRPSQAREQDAAGQGHYLPRQLGLDLGQQQQAGYSDRGSDGPVRQDSRSSTLSNSKRSASSTRSRPGRRRPEAHQLLLHEWHNRQPEGRDPLAPPHCRCRRRDPANHSIAEDSVLLSYLPVSHVYEFFVEVVALTTGTAIAYHCGDNLRLLEHMQVSPAPLSQKIRAARTGATIPTCGRLVRSGLPSLASR